MANNFQAKTFFSRFFQLGVNKYLLSLTLTQSAATFDSLLAYISPDKGEIYNLGCLSRV